jgi:thiol-disulfide isomerase/thioredoxin
MTSPVHAMAGRPRGSRHPHSPLRKLLAFALSLSFVPCLALAQHGPPPDLACRWSAQLTVAPPDHPASGNESFQVPFDLLIRHTSSGLRAALLNGIDRIDFSSVVQQGGAVTLRLEQYDATLSAHCVSVSSARACTSLSGEYVRQRGSALARYALTAQCTVSPASPNSGSESGDAAPVRFAIAADWQFTFADASGKSESEPAHFTAQPLAANAQSAVSHAQHVEGTIAPLSGDYGLLSGVLTGNDGALHLSRFDGIHLLRLDGRFVSHDRIEGVFHDGPGAPLRFVATRSSASSGFEEAEHLTSVQNPSEPFRFHGVDSSGRTVTQSDPAFRGKVLLVDIFGTWCPNCHDEAPLLQSLYAQFRALGFEIVGLSYEYVDDSARNRHLLSVYRRKYTIEFPLLLAGTTAPGQIAKTLPQLRNFGAYPTTIFLDRQGRVRLIHAGFSGPATGRMDELRRSFERTIVKLLDEE